MIIVHHLENSRSQRVLWMLEELDVAYQIKGYQRDQETQLAPPELELVHALGKSPVIEDDGQIYAETGAIIEYLIDKFAPDSFRPPRDSADYYQYNYWLHYAEGSLMPQLLLNLVFQKIKERNMPFFVKPIANGIANKVLSTFVTPNVNRHLNFINGHLADRNWFIGDKLTGADIQMSFPLEASVARGIVPSRHNNIMRFVERIQSRQAYQAALKKGGPYDYA